MNVEHDGDDEAAAMMTLAAYHAEAGFIDTSSESQRQLPAELDPLESACCAISGLIRDGKAEGVRGLITAECAKVDLKWLAGVADMLTTAQKHHFYCIAMYLLNSYAWCLGEHQPPPSFPEPLSAIAVTAANLCGIKPIATHSALILFNLRPIDGQSWDDVAIAKLTADDLEPIHTFTGSRDEEWFYLVTAELELRTVPGVRAVMELCNLLPKPFDAQQHVTSLTKEAAIALLGTIAASIHASALCLKRMGEQMSPANFYNILRPFLTGWKAHPSCPHGIPFDGQRDEFSRLSGASASQSTSIAIFDAFIGTEYEADHFLTDMRRNYMPSSHRAVLELIAKRSALFRERVLPLFGCEGTDAFNAIVKRIHLFRTMHIAVVDKFILKPAKEVSERAAQKNNKGVEAESSGEKKEEGDEDRGEESDGVTGTGGTDIIPFLKEVRHRSDMAAIDSPPIDG